MVPPSRRGGVLIPIPPRVAGIVLAAGTSSRMGRNKLLIEIEGEPVLRRVAGRALQAGLSPVVVVLGHEAPETMEALRGLACQVILHPHFANGMTSSLRAGLAQLSGEDLSAAIMILGDMPAVTSTMLAGLAATHREGHPLVLSRYEDVAAPPTLFGRELFAELEALPDDRCPRSVVRRHRGRAKMLDWPTEALVDLDGPSDLERWQP